MRVLFVVSAFPRHSGDVITPWLVETIRHLGSAGVDVEVLAPAYRGLGTRRIDGVTVHRFRYAPRRLETLTHDQTAPDRVREKPAYLGLVPIYVLAGSLAAMRLARSGRFDLVHVFWPIPHGLLGIAAKRASGIPLVCTFFGVELTWMRRQFPALRSVLRQIVRSSDALTAISKYPASKLRDELPEANPIIIPFGAAIDVPELPPPSISEPDRPFEVLFVGRLVERKGVRYLIDAVARLRSRYNIRLRIVGDGPLRSQLQQHAAELGVADAVQFDGSIPQSELEQRFAACDLFVLPAVVDSKGDTEGLGVVLLEAMAYGKPVVASATGGILDIVRHRETGLLMPPGDSVALADTIAALMLNPGLRQQLAEAGHEYAAREFSWPAIIDRLSRLYAGLSSSRPDGYAPS